MKVELSEARKKELRDDASYFEGLTRFWRVLEKDPETRTEEFLRHRELLAERFTRGRYFLSYRKKLGEESLAELFKFHGLTAEEAWESMYFALGVLMIRKGRKDNIKDISHLRLAKTNTGEEAELSPQ